MEKFILIPTILIEEDLEVNVCLRPSSPLIEQYIATCKTFENETVAISEMDLYIAEMTLLLFSEFKLMENVSLTIKNQFEL